MKSLTLAMLALTLSACQSATRSTSDIASATQEPAAAVPTQPEILPFAQAACGGCHAVRANTLSPNPAVPGFSDIANRTGLTQESLATWLGDAHNYPEDMDFDLDGPLVDALVAYILALRDPEYRAPIS